MWTPDWWQCEAQLSEVIVATQFDSDPMILHSNAPTRCHMLVGSHSGSSVWQTDAPALQADRIACWALEIGGSPGYSQSHLMLPTQGIDGKSEASQLSC